MTPSPDPTPQPARYLILDPVQAAYNCGQFKEYWCPDHAPAPDGWSKAAHGMTHLLVFLASSDADMGDLDVPCLMDTLDVVRNLEPGAKPNHILDLIPKGKGVIHDGGNGRSEAIRQG